MPSDGYAGDVTSAEAWKLLSEDPDAVLVDVRTHAEWTFVGVPDLRPLQREPVLIPWQSYPDMQVNPSFGDQLAAAGVSPDATVLFLCRSGARSRAAAIEMTARGYGRALNVSDGFEGGHDDGGHRGRVDGWKAAGLPWVQN